MFLVGSTYAQLSEEALSFPDNIESRDDTPSQLICEPEAAQDLETTQDLEAAQDLETVQEPEAWQELETAQAPEAGQELETVQAPEAGQELETAQAPEAGQELETTQVQEPATDNQGSAITPCCMPAQCCRPSSRFDLRGDFIYWYSNQSGMGYTTQPQSTFTTSNFSAGTLISPTYDWEPGFRVDAAYGFDQSYWSVGADVIWYRGKGHGSQSTSVVEGLFPAFSFAADSLPTDYANFADIKWRLHSTIFDVLLSYEWVYNCYVTVIPSFGVRNVWLRERANVHYLGGTYEAGTDMVYLKSNFYGIGPRLALKPQFYLGRGFSFYAEGAGSVFARWLNLNQSEKFLSTTRASLTRKFTSGARWGVDTTAGFVYTYTFCNDTNISFDLGFDYFIFFRQNEFVHGPEYTLPSQGTSLMLYGGHAALGFRF